MTGNASEDRSFIQTRRASEGRIPRKVPRHRVTIGDRVASRMRGEQFLARRVGMRRVASLARRVGMRRVASLARRVGMRVASLAHLGWYEESGLAGASGWYEESGLAGTSGWYEESGLAGASGWYESGLAGTSGWYEESGLAGACRVGMRRVASLSHGLVSGEWPRWHVGLV